jgi:hypothetical protein
MQQQSGNEVNGKSDQLISRGWRERSMLELWRCVRTRKRCTLNRTRTKVHNCWKQNDVLGKAVDEPLEYPRAEYHGRRVVANAPEYLGNGGGLRVVPLDCGDAPLKCLSGHISLLEYLGGNGGGLRVVLLDCQVSSGSGLLDYLGSGGGLRVVPLDCQVSSGGLVECLSDPGLTQ